MISLLQNILLHIIIIITTVAVVATATTNSLYSILNIPKSASQSDIKRAYRKAALKHHPDKVPPTERNRAEHKFKEISKAYEWLSDEKKRKLYDAYGDKSLDANFNPLFHGDYNNSGNGGGGGAPTFHFGNAGGGGGFPGGGGFGVGSGMFGGGHGMGGGDFAHHAVDLNELLRQMMGSGMPMGGMNSKTGSSAFRMDREWHQQQQQQQQQRQQQQQQRQHPQYKEYIKSVYCSLEDLSRGCVKKLKVSYRGRDRIYQVRIQPGWKEGTKIKYPSSSPRSSSSSSIEEDYDDYHPPITFVVREKKHPYLQHDIETGDLLWKCKLTTRQAERGAKLKLPLPDGSLLEIESKKGIRSGEQMRVSGRGMLLKSGGGGQKRKKGHVVVEFIVE